MSLGRRSSVGYNNFVIEPNITHLLFVSDDDTKMLIS